MVCAQNVSDLPANSFPFNLSGNTIQTFDNRYEGVKGFATFLEDHSPGTVELKKHEVYKGVLINYDATTDNLIARSERTKASMIVRKDLVESFVLHDGLVEYEFVKLSVDETPTFLLALSRGVTSFFCKISKEIKRAELGGAYNVSGNPYDEFRTVYTFYMTEGNSLKVIPQTKRGIIKLFPTIEKEMNAFFKENKIDLTDLQYARFLFTFINLKLQSKDH
jgi:hypothetical protein